MTENIETAMSTEELLEQRNQVYGDRVSNMANVALMWTGYLRAQFPDIVVRPEDVPVMFQLAKQYRFGVEPEYSDNIDDVEGYGHITREVLGDRLIKARTVDEFVAKRAARSGSRSRLGAVTPEEALARRERAYNSTLEEGE